MDVHGWDRSRRSAQESRKHADVVPDYSNRPRPDRGLQREWVARPMSNLNDFSDISGGGGLQAPGSDENKAALRKPRRMNLLIVGKTGTGKSTLVNAVFGDEVASTGVGRPVTRDLHY